MTAELRARRRLFAALVAFVALLLLDLGLRVLSPGGWTAWEVLLLLCLAANAPWLGLAAATGLLGAARRLRGEGALPPPAPPRLRTLLAVCVRDEDPAAVLPPLARLLDGLVARGHGALFAIAILSDTADPRRAGAEAAAVRCLAKAYPPGSVLHRRRCENAGYKAGNVMDFLDHHAAGFDLMLLLDADSEMTPDAVLRMVAAMEAEPQLAILQSTIAGRPAAAPFGRLFGAGHRPGSLTWAVGQDWWQGAEGPYWGHNALLRIAPFRRHCRLPILPDGAHILSHDHVEAARLHAAGWSVRVRADPSPDGTGSRESHPPNLPEYLVRDRRWAAGNLQYRHLLRDPSLGALGRFQMLQAILHYVLGPLWFAMLPLAALNAATDGEGTPRGTLVALLVLGYATVHLPRLAGHAVALVQGAGLPYLRTALAESLFLLLLDTIIAFDKTLTVLAHALGLRRGTWVAQHRAERRVSWGEAASLLWPHTAAGLAILALLAASGSAFAVLAGLPAVAGLLLAIPFCVLTAAPDAG
ncbi:glucans biosynthesis glucosyltransferase MdoH [Muricoccus nepalensis]|uniref:glucans biosynthesis glucosyltransferase MdoH n=1 Tax=Muricoccus nepalensis TaxID=1854500 RepID=UPI0013866E36|nr:glucans biosynthesis glucosyltransferase MdoH [Roseomonas nepalensis]